MTKVKENRGRKERWKVKERANRNIDNTPNGESKLKLYIRTAR